MLLGLYVAGIGNLLFSQSTRSPYSIFAEGQIENFGTGTNHAMGGTGIAFQSQYYLNNVNPASYSGIDSLSFLFEAGLFGNLTRFSTGDYNNTHFTANLKYLVMGFRFNRWWATSFGILPYSSVGYKISTTDIIEGDLTTYFKTYEGSGGINKFFWGHSIKPFRNFSAGFSLSYYLGSIKKTETGSTVNDYITYSIVRTDKVHSLNLDYGVQYAFRLGDYKYFIGAIFTDNKNMDTDMKCTISYGTDSVDLEKEDVYFYVPRKFGIGLALENESGFKAGLDYEKHFWPGTSFNNSLLKTRDSERYSIGLEYTPYKRRSDKGWKRIFYRVGGSYYKTYLVIDETPVNSASFTLGAGIPVGKELNMMNLSLEAGRTGARNNGLIREDFLVFHVNFTLHDTWFIKYKFK